MLDTVMLGFITDYEQVGYYNTASHLSKVLLSLVTSLSVVAIPRVSYYIQKSDYEKVNQLVGDSFAFVGFLGFPMAVGLMCISPVFVPWFFGSQFTGAILPMEILSYLIIAIGFSNIAGVQVLVGVGREKLFLIAILAGTVLNFSLNCVMIPLYGAIGASVASLATELLVAVIMLYFIYKKTMIRIFTVNDLLKSFVGALLFIPLKYVIPDMENAYMSLAVFGVSAVAIYFISQKLLRNNFLSLTISVISNSINKNKYDSNNT